MSRRFVSCLVVAVAGLMVASLNAQAQIGSVKVGVNYSHYRGPCPAHLRFTGNIYVDRYPMTYNYQWERSDGARTEKHVVRVTSPAQRHLTIFEEWALGQTGHSSVVWERLRVRTGNTDVTSEPANVTVQCQ
jgi:hypothetical protein